MAMYLDATAHCLAGFAASDHAWYWTASPSTLALTQALEHVAIYVAKPTDSSALSLFPVGIADHESCHFKAAPSTNLVSASSL